MDSQTFEFELWPLRDEWRVSAPLLIVLVAIATGAAYALSNLMMGVGVLLALLTCTWEMWLPSHVQVDRTGVRVHPPLGRTKWLPWPDVAACEVHPHGFLLKTATERVPMSVRGLYIRSGPFHEELFEVIRHNHPECLGEQDEYGFDVEMPDQNSYYVDLEQPSTDLLPEESTAKSMKPPLRDDDGGVAPTNAAAANAGDADHPAEDSQAP